MSKAYLSSLADPTARYEHTHTRTKPREGVTSHAAYAGLARALFSHSIWAERSLSGRVLHTAKMRAPGKKNPLGAYPPAIIDVPEGGDYAMATVTVSAALLRRASVEAGFTGGVAAVSAAMGGEPCRRTLVPRELQSAWGSITAHQMRAHTFPLAGLVNAAAQPLDVLVGKELGLRLIETIGDPTINELPTTARKG